MKSTSSLLVRRTEMGGGGALGHVIFAAFLAGAALANCHAFAADALTSAWSSGAKSATRLIASGSFEGGVYHAGAEIKLDPGTLTYWRTPGDAGVPPVFTFDGSENLAKADVHFPAPTRYEEAGTQTFGYKDDVIFPVDVTPKDARHPVEIVLDLHYATCDQICLPAQAKLKLTLGPSQKPGPEAALIAAAQARVPEIANGAGFTATPIAAATPTWAVRFSPRPSASADLFAEAPNGYFFDTKKADGFELVLAQKPPDSEGDVPVTLTLVDGQAAYQSTIRLDVAPAKP